MPPHHQQKQVFMLFPLQYSKSLPLSSSELNKYGSTRTSKKRPSFFAVVELGVVVSGANSNDKNDVFFCSGFLFNG
jgi:hypothetical protein